GGSKIRPLERSIRKTPSGIGKALEIDEGVGASLICCATTATVRIAAGVVHGDHHGLVAGSNADVVERVVVESGEHRDDVVRFDPRFGLHSIASGELSCPLAAIVNNALFAAGLGIRGVVGLLTGPPLEIARRARISV